MVKHLNHWCNNKNEKYEYDSVNMWSVNLKCSSDRCACVLDWFMCLMLIKQFPVNIVGFVWFSIKCQLFNWSWWVCGFWCIISSAKQFIHYIWQITLLRCRCSVLFENATTFTICRFKFRWNCYIFLLLSLHFFFLPSFGLHFQSLFITYGSAPPSKHVSASEYQFCRHNLCIWNEVENT